MTTEGQKNDSSINGTQQSLETDPQKHSQFLTKVQRQFSRERPAFQQVMPDTGSIYVRN